MMDKVQKPSNPECYMPSSEPLKSTEMHCLYKRFDVLAAETMKSTVFGFVTSHSVEKAMCVGGTCHLRHWAVCEIHGVTTHKIKLFRL
jgi:hypothetical protein